MPRERSARLLMRVGEALGIEYLLISAIQTISCQRSRSWAISRPRSAAILANRRLA